MELAGLEYTFKLSGLPTLAEICLCERDAKTYIVNDMYSSTPGWHNHITTSPDDFGSHADFTDLTEFMKNNRNLGHLWLKWNQPRDDQISFISQTFLPNIHTSHSSDAKRRCEVYCLVLTKIHTIMDSIMITWGFQARFTIIVDSFIMTWLHQSPVGDLITPTISCLSLVTIHVDVFTFLNHRSKIPFLHHSRKWTCFHVDRSQLN